MWEGRKHQIPRRGTPQFMQNRADSTWDSPHSWQNLAGPAVIGRPPAGGLEFFAGTPRPTAPMAGDRPPRVDEAEVLGILDAGLGLSRGDPRDLRRGDDPRPALLREGEVMPPPLVAGRRMGDVVAFRRPPPPPPPRPRPMELVGLRLSILTRLEQILTCLSIRSEANLRPQTLHSTRSSSRLACSTAIRSFRLRREAPPAPAAPAFASRAAARGS